MAAQTNSDGANRNVGKFLKEVKGEIKKVHWPDKEELTKYTGVVVATCVLMALFIGIIDSGMGFIMKLILK